MKSSIITIVLSIMVFSANAQENRFRKLWYNGNAEIAVYALHESRYGELREGRRIMVFVTEPLRKSTLVKPDHRLPDDSIVRVIKLNDTREFITGVYNYSVMTSVFQAVENSGIYHTGDAVKVSLSSQEWCGMVYDRMLLRKNRYSGKLFSYFEKESERDYVIPFDDSPIPEENLWLMIRELNGPFMMAGETKKALLIPSLWSRRKVHAPASVASVTIRKKKLEASSSVLGTAPAFKFSWKVGDKTTTVTVEAAYPHRILSFNEADGSKGKLISVKRLPYWKLHKNGDRYLRKELKLSTEPSAW